MLTRHGHEHTGGALAAQRVVGVGGQRAPSWQGREGGAP